MEEFEAYLKCGRLEHGFLRVKCETCRHEKLVAFSSKRCCFCPSCGARRMVEIAAHLVDHILPEQPIRQWVVSFPYPLRFLFSTRPRCAHSSARHRLPGNLHLSHPSRRIAHGLRRPHRGPEPSSNASAQR